MIDKDVFLGGSRYTSVAASGTHLLKTYLNRYRVEVVEPEGTGVTVKLPDPRGIIRLGGPIFYIINFATSLSRDLALVDNEDNSLGTIEDDSAAIVLCRGNTTQAGVWEVILRDVSWT